MKTTIGILGLGPMGGIIATNLLARGFLIVGYDIRAQCRRELEANGGISPDGVVVYRCDWAFPHLIDQVLSDRPKLHLAERKRIVTAAPWIMVPVTLKGGWDALWGMLIALPGILWGHVKADFSNNFTPGRG